MTRQTAAPVPSPTDFAAGAIQELHEGILKYWLAHAADDAVGGFHGALDAEGRPVPAAERSLVLNARILWTFSAAARQFPQRDDYRGMAARAWDYLLSRFQDMEHGGFYWSLDAQGNPADTRKQSYGQAFAIYALAEYYALTRDEQALDAAVSAYELLEEHALETVNGGYLESFTREWQPAGEMQLSPSEMEAPKSFNTNLHVLEAYANLYAVWPDAALHDGLADIVRIHLDTILDGGSEHFRLFFDEEWRPLSEGVSYGHDIEAAWLIHWAAEKLDDDELLERARAAVGTIAGATLRDGLDPEHGGLYYAGGPDGPVDSDKHWWPQAEGAVGFLDAWALAKDDAACERYFAAAWSCWSFAMRHLRDPAGEWRCRSTREGTPTGDGGKIGPWKCPYHNARACLEIARRLAPK